MAYSTKHGRVEGWSPTAFQEARLAADLTFDDLADRLGVSRSQVFSWTQARRPPAALLPMIAKALRVPKRRLIR